MEPVQAQLYLGNNPSVVPTWKSKGRGCYSGRTRVASEPAASSPTFRGSHGSFPVSQLFP